jgi:hypothetical protein
MRTVMQKTRRKETTTPSSETFVEYRLRTRISAHHEEGLGALRPVDEGGVGYGQPPPNPTVVQAVGRQ